MRVWTFACYAFSLAAATFLGRFELHTDDTGVEVFFILLFTFLLGFACPRHPWQWALLIGASIPAAHLLFGSSQPGLAVVTAVVIAIGFAGSYAGVLLRRGIWPAHGF